MTQGGTAGGASPAEPRATWGRRALALLSLLAAFASVATYAQDRRARASAERFVRSFGLERTRPEEVEAMTLEPAGDLAAAMAVAASVSRRPGLRGETPLEPNSPAAAKPSREELRAARDLMLDAVTFRPGWAQHRLLLGLADFQETRQSGRGERWSETLRLATSAAPGMDAAWMALGEAELESWADLSPALRADAPAVFRRCFLNEDFVASRFRDVAVALGRSPAIALLPDDSAALEPAARILAEQGDVEGAAFVVSRLEAAERSERRADLRRLEQLGRLGDVSGLRLACRSWFDRHSYQEFDDAAGRAEVARLLELWPDDRLGSFTRDPRGKLIRFFLDGRESDVRGQVLLRTVESLTGVPESVRARTLLLAGDAEGARALSRAAGPSDLLEWNPYFLQLARRELSEGRTREARAALARLSFDARDGCEALLLRRRIAGALGDREELAAVGARLETLAEVPPEAWESRGAVTVCLDPERGGAQSLEVTVGPGSPAILVFGWNGGRSGTMSIAGAASSFRVPLAGLSGQRNLWASFLVGGTGRSLHASFKAAS